MTLGHALIGLGSLAGLGLLVIGRVYALAGLSHRQEAHRWVRTVGGNLFWTVVHPWLTVRFVRAKQGIPAARVLQASGWRPIDARAVQRITFANWAEAMVASPRRTNEAEIGHRLQKGLLHLGPVISPGVMRAWLPHLHLILVDPPLRKAYRLAASGAPTLWADFGRALTAWWEAAGSLVPFCIEAGLTVDEVRSARTHGHLDEESLRVLIALRRGSEDPMSLLVAA